MLHWVHILGGIVKQMIVFIFLLRNANETKLLGDFYTKVEAFDMVHFIQVHFDNCEQGISFWWIFFFQRFFSEWAITNRVKYYDWITGRFSLSLVGISVSSVSSPVSLSWLTVSLQLSITSSLTAWCLNTSAGGCTDWMSSLEWVRKCLKNWRWH